MDGAAMVMRTVRPVATDRGATLGLADERARDPRITGAKAASLAKARAAGLPVLPGIVLTVDGASGFLGRDPAVTDALLDVWSELGQPLVVRSSSTVEDQGSSSMAGMFTSVLGVTTWDDFINAVERVLASAGDDPMAVLIQPQLDAERGGVMFGLDPVTGRRDRLVVATVAGGPDALVSGRSTGSRSVLTIGGRRLETTGDGPRPGLVEARRLAAIAALARTAFGGPQDVEWATDRNGKLWLLQSRPITAAPSGAPAEGPVFGPGPVAETFPDPLSALELDLWAEPLAEALREILPLVGAATRRSVRRSPMLIDVAGRVAIDLKLIGAIPRRGLVAKLDPRPSMRRLQASWRVGRLRAALPALAKDVIDKVDEELSEFPPPVLLSEDRLVDVLMMSKRVLVSIHGHELMAGLLAEGNATGSGAGTALRDLATGRRMGLSDAEIVSLYPTTLALIPPRIGEAQLPTLAAEPRVAQKGDELIDAREELRLRVRLVQELAARIALELGNRLAARDALTDPLSIRCARLDELSSLIDGDGATPALDDRVPLIASPALPTMFRLTADGDVVETRVDRKARDGQGVSSGRAIGTVFDGTGTPPADAILVVRTLDPSLATLLPRISGLVAETGSVLSHLAILAREFGVPTVVDVADAVARFEPGSRLVVDGSSGDVHLETDEVA
jgi:pyruvate,water dikinase